MFLPVFKYMFYMFVKNKTDTTTREENPQPTNIPEPSPQMETLHVTEENSPVIEDSHSPTDKHVSDAYEEIVKWKRNLFDLPKGNLGKKLSMN